MNRCARHSQEMPCAACLDVWRRDTHAVWLVSAFVTASIAIALALGAWAVWP